MPESKTIASAVTAWGMNVLSSVSLVMVNKYLMTKFGFTFATTLTALHFVATAAIGAFRSPTRAGVSGTGVSSSTTAPSQNGVQRGKLTEPTPSIEGASNGAGSKHEGQKEIEHEALVKNPKSVSASSGGEGRALPMAGVHSAQYLLSLLFPNAELAWDLLVFGVIADVSIAGMNLSLMMNSIGFYQISKLSVLPAVCALEALILKKSFSLPALLGVLMVTVGVGVCTVTDFSLHVIGCLVALVAVISTALQQVLIGTLQRRHHMTSFELLSHTAPIQAGMLLFLGPVCDNAISGENIFRFNFSLPAIGAIFLTCVLAILCNLSQYMCLGRFSATSFQVLGNLKTILVLICGWLLFGAQLTLANTLGMILAMAGMVFYSWIVQREKNEQLSVKKMN